MVRPDARIGNGCDCRRGIWMLEEERAVETVAWAIAFFCVCFYRAIEKLALQEETNC